MRHFVPIVLSILLGIDAAHAQEKNADAGCVDVEVNGERARDDDCLSRLLTPSSGAARPAARIHSEEIAGRPSNALGLAKTEATRQRLGSNFGKSTLPQRPPQAPPALPPALRPRP